MAREYARIMTAIWRNKEFRGLGEGPQRLYLLLVTQPDISAAGVLPLRLRRWADMGADSKPDQIAATLSDLEAGRFIVADFDTEEVLVRSFIRWDGGYNNPKRRPVIVRAAQEVDSPRLLRALALEFQRCELPPLVLPELSDTASDRQSGSDLLGYAEPHTDDTPETMFPQVDSLSDSPSDSESPSDGVVVTYLSTTDTTTHNPQTVPPSAGARALPDLAVVPEAQTPTKIAQALAKTYYERVPLTNFAAVMKIAKQALAAGYTPERIEVALSTLADENRTVTANSLRIALDGPPLRAVSGGYQPYRNPTDPSVWDEPLLPPNSQENL